MGLAFAQVDAFTNRRFSGNPAAVCLLPGPARDDWMQQVAAEMNLSETAFLHRQEDGFNLRWFTPTVEVDLCGHATLASAHWLWETGALSAAEAARFHTRSGLLTAAKNGAFIELDFPATPCEPAAAPTGLLEALNTPARFVGRTRFDYLVEVDAEDTVRGLAPDMPALQRVPARGVMVTSRSSVPEFDFVSRFFAPASGIPEDPVTGSAHCCLGPFWGARLGKERLVGYQASRRGGVVSMTPRGDRVTLGGQAVTVLTGELLGD